MTSLGQTLPSTTTTEVYLNSPLADKEPICTISVLIAITITASIQEDLQSLTPQLLVRNNHQTQPIITSGYPLIFPRLYPDI